MSCSPDIYRLGGIGLVSGLCIVWCMDLCLLMWCWGIHKWCVILKYTLGKRNPIDKALNSSLDRSPESEPAKELTSRAAPRVEAHHRVNGPDTGRNSGGRLTIKKVFWVILLFHVKFINSITL